MVANVAYGQEDGKYYIQICCGGEHTGKECDCKEIANNLTESKAKELAEKTAKELGVTVQAW